MQARIDGLALSIITHLPMYIACRLGLWLDSVPHFVCECVTTACRVDV